MHSLKLPQGPPPDFGIDVQNKKTIFTGRDSEVVISPIPNESSQSFWIGRCTVDTTIESRSFTLRL